MMKNWTCKVIAFCPEKFLTHWENNQRKIEILFLDNEPINSEFRDNLHFLFF